MPKLILPGRWTYCAIHIDCPWCGQGWSSPANGSFMICQDDREFVKAGEVTTCDACGEQFKIPAVIAKL